MKTTAYNISIHIAGDLSAIRATCRTFCEQGCCVTVTPTEFIYTGGAETGATIGLMNYARFPSGSAELDKNAFALAESLLQACSQKSCSVVTPTESHFLTNSRLAPK